MAPTAGWSGYWQRQFGTAHELKDKYPSNDARLARALRTGIGNRKLRATILALTGVAVGGASKALSRKRVKATQALGQTVVQNGIVPVETQVLLSGNTTSADLARVDTNLVLRPRPASYPVERGGYRPGRIGSLV